MPDPATRERLLDAAWDIANEGGVEALTLAGVGARAGVSRQAVYLHFANRATLLVEMTRRSDRVSGFRARVAAARRLPAADGFRRLLEEWFDYVPVLLPVARGLEAAALAGGDGAEAYHDRMDDWREGLRISVQALAEAGVLDDRWDVAHATDWVWAIVHPTNVLHLTVGRGWDHARVADVVIGSLERELCRPARVAAGD